MKKSFEFEAKKVEQAISDGLSALGRTVDEVEINIISTGGLFKKAKIEIIIDSPDVVVAETKPTAKEEVYNAKKETSVSESVTADKKEVKPEPKKAEQKPQTQKPKTENKQEHKSENKPQQQDRQKRRGDRVVPTEQDQETATKFLQGLLKAGGIEGEVKGSISDSLSLEIVTSDSCVIGSRGETLDSLQYLATAIINKESGKFKYISLDAMGYRAKRADSLKRLAQKMADKCLKNSRRIGLEPMNSQDRKIIHAFLGEIEGVVTKSEGHEPHRRIVIYPQRKR